MDWALYSQFFGKFRNLRDEVTLYPKILNGCFKGAVLLAKKPSEFQLTASEWLVLFAWQLHSILDLWFCLHDNCIVY